MWSGELPWRASAVAHSLLACLADRAAQFPKGYYHPVRLLESWELRTLQSLADGQRVSGDIINAYCSVLNARTSALLSLGQTVPSVCLLSSYFMSKLCEGTGYNYADAAKHVSTPRTLERHGSPFTSILEYRFLVAPCHLPSDISPELDHWVLTVADLELCAVYTVDPLMVRVRVMGGQFRSDCRGVGCTTVK